MLFTTAIDIINTLSAAQHADKLKLEYEKGSIIFTTNRAFKHWPEIFNNDSIMTSAVLDRLRHHAETVVIEGQSYRMKNQIEP